jgi:hypothetical protein
MSNPCVGGILPTVTPYDPPGNGVLRPPLTLLCARRDVDTRSIHAKNITHTQHSSTCCFLCVQGVIRLHSQQSREEIPIDPLHQENFSTINFFLMNLKHSSKCSPSSETPYFLQPCLSQSDIEHRYSLSLNDKLGSLPKKLHYGCHNLSFHFVVPTQYLNKIFVTILLPWFHEWLPCIQLL